MSFEIDEFSLYLSEIVEIEKSVGDFLDKWSLRVVRIFENIGRGGVNDSPPESYFIPAFH